VHTIDALGAALTLSVVFAARACPTSRSHRGAPKRPAARRLQDAVALGVLLAVVAAGCAVVAPPPPPPPPTPPTTLEVSANPGLFPTFDPTITDYVIRCTGAPVQVTIGAPDGTTVSVDGQPAQSGRFTASVNRTTGESFTLATQTAPAAPITYYVRCLPTDFPTWTASRTGTTQAEWYLTAPISGTSGNYPTIFDNNGVPIWWGPQVNTGFVELLPDGNLAWTKSDGTPAEERRLDGSLVNTITPSGGTPDLHDLLRLPNGDYVMVADTIRTGVDFSSWGGPASASVLDAVIQELTPTGTVVWSWDTADHIPVSETDPQWRASALLNGGIYDAYHWNSIEATGTGFIVSYRHLDAVYDIDQSSGNLVWKLGGSATPESLTIANDPVFTNGSHFGGQHDARLLADGTVTAFDDGTNLGRAPRAVRYQIDTGTHAATMLGQQSDPTAASASPCCGSARLLPGGDWIMGWGGTNTISELDSTGTRVFLMQFASGTLIYRALPVPYGQLDRATLRADMDAQHP
jgi:outer membrane protein assembly factor BamB